MEVMNEDRMKETSEEGEDLRRKEEKERKKYEEKTKKESIIKSTCQKGEIFSVLNSFSATP
jgi:hypothetical protein